MDAGGRATQERLPKRGAAKPGGFTKEKGLNQEAFFCSSISPISELFFQR
jgi:hypothetical protein